MGGLIDFLIPKGEKFYEMLSAQSANVVAASREFQSLLKSYSRLPQKEREKRFRRIKDLEHKGDACCQEIILKLHRTFVTPIDREDIHELTLLLDDLIDLMDVITKRFRQYKVTRVTPLMLQQAQIAAEVVMEVDDSIQKLVTHRPTSHYKRIHELEDRADVLHDKAMKELFGGNRDAVEIMKLKDLHDLFEILTDKGQDVAVLIQGIVVKHA